MLSRLTFLLPLLLVVSARVVADAGDQYFSCRSCHGDDGFGSPAIHAPALAGQSQQYIARQLQNFRRGIRGKDARDIWGRQMALMAANLNDNQVESVSEYIAALPAWPAGEKSPTEDAEGAGLFVTCIACHGIGGEGKPELNAPRIGGLDSTYIATQLRHFRSGIRGSDKEDIYGQQMRAALPATLDDNALKKLARYIQGL